MALILTLHSHRVAALGVPLGPLALPTSWPRRPAALVHGDFRALANPVIVIGAHRSGTSVAAGLLAGLGVYMGSELLECQRAAQEARPVELRGNGEAGAFYAANERLLARAGAGWNRVGPFLEQRDHGRFSLISTRLLQLATFGSLRWDYLEAMPPTPGGRWGWKDPRNSLTLPNWLQLFPEARVIHARRDMAAVATSLHRRAHEWLAEPPAAASLGRRLRGAVADPIAAARAVARRAGLAPAAAQQEDPCLDLAYCRRLSQQYLQQCFRHRDRGGCFLELHYEEMLADPLASVDILATFCQLDPSPARRRRVAGLVRRRETVALGNPEAVRAA